MNGMGVTVDAGDTTPGHPPCSVVGCTSIGTHWRRDERRPVVQTVLVCIAHQVAGELAPIPPREIDEVGARLEALVAGEPDGVWPSTVARKLRIPPKEMLRIARLRGVPMVAGMLRPKRGQTVSQRTIDEVKAWAAVEVAAEPERASPGLDDDEGDPFDDLDDEDDTDTDIDHEDDDLGEEGVAPSTETVREFFAGVLDEPVVAEEEPAVAAALSPTPKVTKRDRLAPKVTITALKRTRIRAKVEGRGPNLQELGAAYRQLTLGVLADGAWHPPAEVKAAIRKSGASAESAESAASRHLARLCDLGEVIGKGRTSSRLYRLVRAPEPSPSAQAPAVLTSPCSSAEAAEGPGALGDRMGRALAAAARAFLAEWERA